MVQWLQWSITGQWTGKDGLDYLKQLPSIRVPMLTIAAAGDRWIAPESGCAKLHGAVGSSMKQFVVAGRKNGFSEDFSHARVISSRAASTQIWPVVLDWLDNLQTIGPDAEHPLGATRK